ncbi:50S ribosomal protein L18 [Candidatus Falkowbacteria bacterium RIFOXYB2_FULL_47_14]|uniref:Large ribosomal subunit protein uL18 n=1 Tax=Candidatus Falkowbacteria bacterium RIFOXYA2_FULL_47_19 TaxID=1797994 RepID=A0A1F5SIF4_9BACT|nr:MAG: 50S ribosomal protein L18 [Candidatus Falkowbacteria bacterium RIFOXYA2_FULL_47_19]OGF35446.1 MAG: 50S ribosomal protein L18 [Candidatus Falkowbacteria bacterium RIFOXYC2_FULL_46_15]OGF42562.1 MAG: 50S ribosomal protein L18 [Candidatus Falkowbacteria bacterium RIFOXYB2_FULL_47_14]
MDQQKRKKTIKTRKHAKIRAKIRGIESRVRLSIFRSNRGFYVQVIDDREGKTLVSAHSQEIKGVEDKDRSGKTAVGFAVGKLIAKKALEKKIEKVVFDRGGNKYHGRVKAVADGAREGGLKF